jgi:ParB family chromosome partitioning protein
LSQEDRHRLFAFCAASTINAVRVSHISRSDQIRHANKLAQSLGLHMVAAGWTPTAENYLSRVSKGHILEAVTEAKGEETAHLMEGMKKPGMVMEAERLLTGTGWLPVLLRSIEPVVAHPAEDADASPLPAFLDADAGAEQPAH